MIKKISDTLKETARVEICGAFPETLLNACAACAIEFWDMECVDSYTLRLSVYSNRCKELENEAARCMCDVKRLSASFGNTAPKLLLRRRWLIMFAVLAAALLTASSLFIWDFEIYGNEKLSSGKILRALEECGVGVGTYWPKLSSDLVRSQMVEVLPELAWMSVNISGSRAEVLIVERKEKPEIYAESAGADIIAKTNGIISKLSVFNGTPAVSDGQTVISGEMLVSGTVESMTGDTRTVRSLASVEADTWYEISAVCPTKAEKKLEVKKKRNQFALQIGKRRINIFINGRKAVDGCDKIIHKYTLGVEGLFSLPLSLIREEYIYYSLSPTPCADEESMFACLQAALEEQMDGHMLERSFSSWDSSGLTYATLRAHCYENIAVTREIQP